MTRDASDRSGKERRAAIHEVGGVPLLVVSMPTEEGPWAALSPAEARVAELAVAGLSNGEIARRRGTSARTVANQLASVFRKVGVGSRLALAERLLASAGEVDDGAG